MQKGIGELFAGSAFHCRFAERGEEGHGGRALPAIIPSSPADSPDIIPATPSPLGRPGGDSITSATSTPLGRGRRNGFDVASPRPGGSPGRKQSPWGHPYFRPRPGRGPRRGRGEDARIIGIAVCTRTSLIFLFCCCGRVAFVFLCGAIFSGFVCCSSFFCCFL